MSQGTVTDLGTIVPPLTVAFSFVDILIHLEVQVGASQMGSCSKELQHILLLHLKDIQTSGHCDHFPCELRVRWESWRRIQCVGQFMNANVVEQTCHNTNTLRYHSIRKNMFVVRDLFKKKSGHVILI